jgi:hypothetical protein
LAIEIIEAYETKEYGCADLPEMGNGKAIDSQAIIEHEKWAIKTCLQCTNGEKIFCVFKIGIM